MLVPVMEIQGCRRVREPVGRHDVGARCRDFGLVSAVARWPLAARDVDLLAGVVEGRHADDPVPAGERADGV